MNGIQLEHNMFTLKGYDSFSGTLSAEMSINMLVTGVARKLFLLKS